MPCEFLEIVILMLSRMHLSKGSPLTAVLEVACMVIRLVEIIGIIGFIIFLHLLGLSSLCVPSVPKSE